VLRDEPLSADQLAALIPELEYWMTLIAATTLFPGRRQASAPPGLPPGRIMELFELARDAVTAARRAAVTLSGLVTMLYQTFLSRAPDPGGLASWVRVFREARVNMAATGFMSSAEFQGLVSDRTNAAQVRPVVTRFYTEILGRTPGTAEVE
jgi:Domain of unknown function (DUF4214)